MTVYFLRPKVKFIVYEQYRDVVLLCILKQRRWSGSRFDGMRLIWQ